LIIKATKPYTACTHRMLLMPQKYKLFWRRKSGWVYGLKVTAAGMPDIRNIIQNFRGF